MAASVGFIEIFPLAFVSNALQSLTGEQAAADQQALADKAALIASVGGQRSVNPLILVPEF